MDLSNFKVLNNELMDKDPHVAPEQEPLVLNG